MYAVNGHRQGANFANQSWEARYEEETLKKQRENELINQAMCINPHIEAVTSENQDYIQKT